MREPISTAYPCELDLGGHDLSYTPMEKLDCRTVNFLVCFVGKGPGHALCEVKIEGGQIPGKIGGSLDLVCKFFDRRDPEVPKEYLLSATRFGSRSNLYLLQHQKGQVSDTTKDWWLWDYSTRSPDTYKGLIFDPTRKYLMPFKLPKFKNEAVLISAYGKLYHIAHPSMYMADPSFEVYDPDNGSWTRLSTFPDNRLCRIVGYAVCHDCILMSIQDSERCSFWVYQVTLDQWKQVNAPSDKYYAFRGRAVVVGHTIYALSAGTIKAFSLMMEELPDGSINYFLDKPLVLCGLHTLFFSDSKCEHKTECLVHLGGLNFCLLQTVQRGSTSQRVWITVFDIVSSQGRERIRTLGSTMRKVAIKGLGQFFIESGFCVECEDLEPKGRDTIQPTVDPRMHKHEKATLKILRRQIRRLKRKMMTPRSMRSAMVRKLFRFRRYAGFCIQDSRRAMQHGIDKLADAVACWSYSWSQRVRCLPWMS